MEQIHQLLEAARGHPQEALFALALHMGMRRGELLGLKWQDISFTEGDIASAPHSESRAGDGKTQ